MWDLVGKEGRMDRGEMEKVEELGKMEKGKIMGVRRAGRERSGSVGCIWEEWLAGKRKEREAGKSRESSELEGEVFKRSKMTTRSPVKEVEEREELVRMIMKGMREEWGRIEDKLEEWKVEERRDRESMRKLWEEERREMGGRVEVLERRVEELERKLSVVEGAGESGGRRGEEVGVEESSRKLREIEIRMDRREREVRRRNVVIKGVKVGEGDEWIREVEGMWGKMGVEGGRRDMRRIGGADKWGRGMVLVEMEGLEKKRELMRAKRRLKGERVWIEDDLTKEERRVRWLVEREAEAERAKGKRVQVGYMRLWVDGKLRRWDEIRENWMEMEGNG